MRRPPLGDPLSVALDLVVEAEARSAEVTAPGPDDESVVEAHSGPVVDVRFQRGRVYPSCPQRGVPALEPREVLDPRNLEPVEIGRMMSHPLSIGLGEANLELDREVELSGGRSCDHNPRELTTGPIGRPSTIDLAVTPELEVPTVTARAPGKPSARQGRAPRVESGVPLSANTRRAISRLADLIGRKQPCVVLTGAGVSTESGIPDFRSPTGLWAEFDPLEYASIEAFRADPEKVWRFYARRISMLVEAEPNAAHVALAELERRGLVRAIVTQNIDLLHERAGSLDVVEVHGSIRTATCPHCGAEHSLARVLEMIGERPGEPPRCGSCAAILKPDVVFFGELLPEQAIDRASGLARSAGLLLVVGSSLEVFPVAGLPYETLRAGGEVAIVNRGSTPLDGRAAVKLDGSAAEILPVLLDEL